MVTLVAIAAASNAMSSSRVPLGHRRGALLRESTSRVDAVATNSPFEDSDAEDPVNHPTRSTITCPPAVVVMTKPAGDTGTMTDAARARPLPSWFMNDVVVDSGPAGRTLRNPVRRPPTVVTLIAIA